MMTIWPRCGVPAMTMWKYTRTCPLGQPLHTSTQAVCYFYCTFENVINGLYTMIKVMS